MLLANAYFLFNLLESVQALYAVNRDGASVYTTGSNEPNSFCLDPVFLF